MTHSLEQSNRTILGWGSGSGTTVMVAEIYKHRVRTYHAGDSEYLLCGNRGRIIQSIVPHSPVGFAIEAGTLKQSEAITHKDRHYVSNYVGNRNMYVSVSQFKKIKLRDTLLIATDGLFDNLHLDEIVSIICQGKLEQVSNHLLERTYDRINGKCQSGICKPDDLTFMLYRRNSC